MSCFGLRGVHISWPKRTSSSLTDLHRDLGTILRSCSSVLLGRIALDQAETVADTVHMGVHADRVHVERVGENACGGLPTHHWEGHQIL